MKKTVFIEMNRTSIITICVAVSIIILGSYLYSQNQKIDQLQQALVNQQGTKQLKETSNGYTQKPSGRVYNTNSAIAIKASNELRNRQKGYRDHWIDFVNVSPSEFLTREIGGIFDLKVTVENKFDVQIDKLIAIVTYVKANGDVHKTQEIAFTNIPAGSIVTLPAKDSSRGTNVKVDILSIYVTEYNLCFPGNNRIESDPYLCVD